VTGGAIRTFDYLASLPEVADAVRAAVERVLTSGQLILGPETAAFEAEFAAFVGARECIAVSSGTTAIHLAMMALGLGTGDEVITVSNTCAPTVAGVRLTGAGVAFADVRADDLMMDVAAAEKRIGPATRCLLPVHLWGNAVAMDALTELARRRGLKVVEDCCQAHGTRFGGAHVGTFGDAGCFSFYPTKNLGAYGDAGAVVTNDPALAERLRALRMYGYDARQVARAEGMNARIGEMQAAILRVKLRCLPDWLARRRQVAEVYDRKIRADGVALPRQGATVTPSHHQYVIRCADRERVAAALKANDIGYGIHYPVPVHLMPAYGFMGGEALDLPETVAASRAILSLPIHEAISAEQAARVADAVNGA